MTATVHSNLIIFRWKLHKSIEKCLLYSAIKKIAQTDARKSRYCSSTKKVENGDGIWIRHSRYRIEIAYVSLMISLRPVDVSINKLKYFSKNSEIRTIQRTCFVWQRDKSFSQRNFPSSNIDFSCESFWMNHYSSNYKITFSHWFFD